MVNEKRVDVLCYKIGMFYHPNFEESLWNVTDICEVILEYAESTVRTNVEGGGRPQASKAWANIHKKVEERGDAYYARPRDIANFLEDTIDVGGTKFKEKAECLRKCDFLMKIEDAWSSVV